VIEQLYSEVASEFVGALERLTDGGVSVDSEAMTAVVADLAGRGVIGIPVRGSVPPVGEPDGSYVGALSLLARSAADRTRSPEVRDDLLHAAGQLQGAAARLTRVEEEPSGHVLQVGQAEEETGA